jgi:glucosamine 6-phosphate synthetase-like amidotransferase/phosphosugar isomerase protein
MVRECKLAYITRAGVEIGVASTKAFTTQLAGLFLLTLALAQVKGRLSDEEEARHLKAMRHLPAALQAVLALEPQVISWAEDFAARKTRCSWAAACITPLRWKARSSSRRSPTSTPRPTRPVNSSTARWRW